MTDFFSETSSSLGQKNTRKVPVKGSLDFFFKKAAAKESPTAPSGSSVKRQRSPRENYVLDIMCDVCTFENHAPNNVGEEWIPCEACGNLLKSNESEVSNKKLCSSDSPPGEKTSLGKTSWREETIFSWSCKTCTLSNSKPVSKRNWYACEACGEPHIDDAPESSSSPNDEFTEQLATPCVDRKLPPAVSTGATTTPNRRQTRESLSSPEVIVLDSPVDRPPSFISGSQVIEIDCADTPLVSKKQRAAKLSSPEVIVLDMEDDNPAGRKVVAKVSTNSRRKVVPRHAFEFSVSQHSGRMTVHFSDDGESSLVNFGVDEVLSERTADSLLDARIKKASVPKQQMQLEFDDASIRSLSLRVKTARASCRSSVLGNELKEFVANYLRLRAVERKTLQDSGKAFPGRSLSQAVAQLMTVSKTATERYAGGAKERARENADNGVASASDVSVLEGRSCAWCGTGMSGSAIKAGSTYCSQECAEEGRLRRGGKFAAVQIRAATFALEGGTCTICGMNAHDLFEQIRALQPPERLNKLLSANWALPKSSKALERLLNDPKEGNFWQVDHIRAVAEGGGSCGMENLRTLCVPCHTRETAQLHSRLKLHGAANSDEKHSQVDIRSAFLPAAAKSSRKGSLNQR